METIWKYGKEQNTDYSFTYSIFKQWLISFYNFINSASWGKDFIVHAFLFSSQLYPQGLEQSLA